MIKIYSSSEIDNLARKDMPFADDMNITEIGLYTALKTVYTQFTAKTITEEQARKAKKNYIGEYESYLQWCSISAEDTRRRNEISKLSVKAEKEGCPICKQMARIFDGRQREINNIGG